MRYEVTLTRPAYEVVVVEIDAAMPAAAEAEALALAQADDLEWEGGDPLPDAPTVIACQESEDQP